MSLFLFLTVVQAIIAAALVAVILMQRSEGGGLGIGGSPGGVMGARGSADFLTKSTRWLAVAFVAMSILLAAVAVEATGGSEFRRQRSTLRHSRINQQLHLACGLRTFGVAIRLRRIRSGS